MEILGGNFELELDWQLVCQINDWYDCFSAPGIYILHFNIYLVYTFTYIGCVFQLLIFTV